MLSRWHDQLQKLHVDTLCVRQKGKECNILGKKINDYSTFSLTKAEGCKRRKMVWGALHEGRCGEAARVSCIP